MTEIKLVLGIETSCDETALALYHAERGLLDQIIYSQISKHQKFGGVVPELAARDHSNKLVGLARTLLENTGTEWSDLDGVAYTAGPGLIGALMTGAMFGRSLAYALDIPAMAVHHMEGHLLAPMLSADKPELPFLALLVSGGHTMLVRVQAVGEYEILGESLDDAAGEAFDKTAKLLGLPYPGGPAIAALAEQGNPERFTFPRPMVNRPGLDFSFSGLKTHAVNTLQTEGDDLQTKADIACAFQRAVVETLVIKCRRALEQTQLTRLVVAGGVSANKALRLALTQMLEQHRGAVFYPEFEFCTDNAAMIAYAGWLRLSAGQSASLAVQCHARWPITLI